MNKQLLTITFCFLSVCIQAQISERSVLANSGNSDANTHLQVDWTLGEISIETIENANISLNQGFHQNLMEVSLIEEFSEVELSIYPNPANEFVVIDVSNDQEGLNYFLYDLSGKLLAYKNNINNKEEINLSNFTENTYFLVIYHEEKEIRNTYKIEKIK